MRLYSGESNSILFIKLEGKLLAKDVSQLRKIILSYFLPRINHVLIDLEDVTFIDSSGMGLLVGLKMSAGKIQSHFYLIAPQQHIKNLLIQTKLNHIFTAYPTVNDIPVPADGEKISEVLDSCKLIFDSDKLFESASGKETGRESMTELVLEEEFIKNESDWDEFIDHSKNEASSQTNPSEYCNAINVVIMNNDIQNSYRELQSLIENASRYSPDNYLLKIRQAVSKFTLHLNQLNQKLNNLELCLNVKNQSDSPDAKKSSDSS